MAAAKRSGKQIGRPRKLTPAQIATARGWIESDAHTRECAAARLGVHVATLRRALRPENAG